MKKQTVATKAAPAAIGPYSQGIVAGNLVFVSGQIPLDPATGKLVEGDISAQADRVLRNVRAILEAAGSSLDQVVKTSVFLADLADFEAVNRVYAGFFRTDPPARATFQAAGLPKGALLEIEAVAILAGENA